MGACQCLCYEKIIVSLPTDMKPPAQPPIPMSDYKLHLSRGKVDILGGMLSNKTANVPSHWQKQLPSNKTKHIALHRMQLGLWHYMLLINNKTYAGELTR